MHRRAEFGKLPEKEQLSGNIVTAGDQESDREETCNEFVVMSCSV